jgi:DNA-binding transcriptional ArsR family regulator
MASHGVILKSMVEQSATIDRVFQALADPHRRDLLERLGHDEATVSELAEPLEISLQAVLQHVQVLEVAGLLATEKRGRVRYCRVVPAGLSAAERWIAQRKRDWETRLDRLEAFLAESTDDESSAHD